MPGGIAMTARPPLPVTPVRHQSLIVIPDSLPLPRGTRIRHLRLLRPLVARGVPLAAARAALAPGEVLGASSLTRLRSTGHGRVSCVWVRDHAEGKQNRLQGRTQRGKKGRKTSYRGQTSPGPMGLITG